MGNDAEGGSEDGSATNKVAETGGQDASFDWTGSGDTSYDEGRLKRLPERHPLCLWAEKKAYTMNSKAGLNCNEWSTPWQNVPNALMWGIINPVVWQHQEEKVLFLNWPVLVPSSSNQYRDRVCKNIEMTGVGVYHTILKFPDFGPDIHLTEQVKDFQPYCPYCKQLLHKHRAKSDGLRPICRPDGRKDWIYTMQFQCNANKKYHAACKRSGGGAKCRPCTGPNGRGEVMTLTFNSLSKASSRLHPSYFGILVLF